MVAEGASAYKRVAVHTVDKGNSKDQWRESELIQIHTVTHIYHDMVGV